MKRITSIPKTAFSDSDTFELDDKAPVSFKTTLKRKIIAKLFDFVTWNGMLDLVKQKKKLNKWATFVKKNPKK